MLVNLTAGMSAKILILLQAGVSGQLRVCDCVTGHKERINNDEALLFSANMIKYASDYSAVLIL